MSDLLKTCIECNTLHNLKECPYCLHVKGLKSKDEIEVVQSSFKIWNEAIEAAALIANEDEEDTIADRIRRLKK